MPHEIEKEALSAFLDQELAPAEHERIQAHLAACADCQGYLARIRSVSGVVKRHGRHALPPTVEAVALAEVSAAARRRRLKSLAGAVAVAVCVTVAGAIALKRFMPGLFAQVQGMISGAANSLGR